MTFGNILKRTCLQLAWPLATLYWFVRRPRVQASACVVRRGDEVLLVRHTYGRRDEWAHPGGLMEVGEDPAVAAAREVSEETGLLVGAPQFLWTKVLRRQSRHVTLHIFVADVSGGALDFDPVEIAAAQWFDISSLPEPLRAYTAESIEAAAALAPV